MWRTIVRSAALGLAAFALVGAVHFFWPRTAHLRTFSAEEVYGTRDERVGQSAQLRAAMMNYRDQRSEGRMCEEDWQTLQEGLVQSFTLLKAAVEESH